MRNELRQAQFGGFADSTAVPVICDLDRMFP
ncbi:hypothetical protein X736_31680 [Mesorhizobium sp. L2C089B000]|nr:hypothetical protein X736_31680 [Mesorhizobium sp. L2C089B000]